VPSDPAPDRAVVLITSDANAVKRNPASVLVDAICSSPSAAHPRGDPGSRCPVEPRKSAPTEPGAGVETQGLAPARCAVGDNPGDATHPRVYATIPGAHRGSGHLAGQPSSPTRPGPHPPRPPSRQPGSTRPAWSEHRRSVIVVTATRTPRSPGRRRRQGRGLPVKGAAERPARAIQAALARTRSLGERHAPS
jgi:hypothetical protein